MEKEDLKQKAEEFLNDKDLPQKIETFPTLIVQKISLISELENKVTEAKKAAEEAKVKADNLKGYEEKSTFWKKLKWKSGKTKDIIENTQAVTKDIALATGQNAEALELAMKFEKELATTAEFLFYLGCYNIATNEAMIADLNEQLRKDDIKDEGKRIKLSTKVKEQFENVVKRLQAQRDVLYQQEKLRKKSKQYGAAIARNIDQINEHESRLEEKDRIDREQTEQINEHESRLKDKDRIDKEQTEQINEHESRLKDKDRIDKEQTEQINEHESRLEEKDRIDKEQTDQINEHESRLEEKDRIDKEQTVLINGIKKSLSQMDEELSDKIKKLIQSIEEKTSLDKEQTYQIEEVREKIELAHTKYDKLRNNVIIGFIVISLSITCIIGWLVFIYNNGI